MDISTLQAKEITEICFNNTVERKENAKETE